VARSARREALSLFGYLVGGIRGGGSGPRFGLMPFFMRQRSAFETETIPTPMQTRHTSPATATPLHDGHDSRVS
jgi:hypothetical protein